jgi:uncharacterized protein (DUF2384 family)
MNKKQSSEALYTCQYNAVLKTVNNMFFHNEEKSKFWIESPNPLLGNVSPVSMLKIGRFDKLMGVIYTSIYENEAPNQVKK